MPTHCIINESKFRKDPQIGHIIDKYPEIFEERANADHVKLIFFVMHEMGKGDDSFWAPYFETAELPDLLARWEQSDLDELHDPILKQESIDEMEEMREEFGELRDAALANSDCINIDSFTFEMYMKANYHVGTRCFGYAIPELSLVPFADNANHHTTDNQYEMFNFRISNKMRQDMNSLTEIESKYATSDRRKIDFFKNLPQEKKDQANLPTDYGEQKALPKQAARYVRKVERRHQIMETTTS